MSVDTTYSRIERQYLAIVQVTAEEARCIAEWIPSTDAASREWLWVANKLDTLNRLREDQSERDVGA